MMKIYNPAIWLIPAAALLAALASWPYGYYQLLRVVVTVAAVVICVMEFQRGRSVTGWIVAFALVAAIFNPIAPVHLDRETWAVIDVGVAGMFAAHWWLRSRPG